MNFIKKYNKKYIKDNVTEYIEDQFNNYLVHSKNTEENDINNDMTTKWMILNKHGENIQKIIY